MVNFIIGEDRHVKFRVHSALAREMIVEQASYTFSQYGQVEASGECEITNDGENPVLDIKLYPKAAGGYQLDITYQVADETLKHREEVRVI